MEKVIGIGKQRNFSVMYEMFEEREGLASGICT
jgi:hypothetical protein